MSSPFLSESWERKASAESGEPEFEDKSAGLYLDLVEKTEKIPELREMMIEVERAIVDYVEALNETAKARIDQDPKMVESTDKRQRRLHNILVDALNQLSRAFSDRGLDNRWRGLIGYPPDPDRDREDLARWALSVAESITRKEFPEQ